MSQQTQSPPKQDRLAEVSKKTDIKAVKAAIEEKMKVINKPVEK